MNNENKLLELYISMKKIRMVEDAIANEYPNREMHTPIHLYTGEEAIATGVCASLEKTDYVVSNHRCHGHYLAKGGNLNRMISELYNKETGCTSGRGGSMHLIDNNVNFSLTSSIVAGGVPIGAGLALSSRIKNSKDVTVVFLGDAASEEGCVYESICFSKLFNLPIVYVCENNLYSICTPLDKREPTKNVSDKFSKILDTHIIDGNDVLEVYNKAKDAIDNARNGRGPTFIECKTYRLKDHHNIFTGVSLGYRTQEEWDEWNKKSPISSFENFLINKNILSLKCKKEIEAKIENEINKAFLFAKESSLPNKNELLKNIYSEEN